MTTTQLEPKMILPIIHQLTSSINTTTTVLELLIKTQLEQKQQMGLQKKNIVKFRNLDDQGNIRFYPPKNTKYCGKIEAYNPYLEHSFDFKEELCPDAKLRRIMCFHMNRQQHNFSPKPVLKSELIDVKGELYGTGEDKMSHSNLGSASGITCHPRMGENIDELNATVDKTAYHTSKSSKTPTAKDFSKSWKKFSSTRVNSQAYKNERQNLIRLTYKQFMKTDHLRKCTDLKQLHYRLARKYSHTFSKLRDGKDKNICVFTVFEAMGFTLFFTSTTKKEIQLPSADLWKHKELWNQLDEMMSKFSLITKYEKVSNFIDYILHFVTTYLDADFSFFNTETVDKWLNDKCVFDEFVCQSLQQ